MVRFYSEDIKFNLKDKLAVKRWLKKVAVSESKKLGGISIIFCSDNYVLDVNIRYLKHDYYTDIITFDYCIDDVLSGDLFISVDSVKKNSLDFGTDFTDELHRVIVHGLLHLIGYDDHTEEEQIVMRSKEDHYLKERVI